MQFKSILIKFSFIPEWSDVLAFCTGEFQTTENANLWVWLYGALTDLFSLLQLINFSLIPIRWRTAYTGLCGFLWATFLCFSQQEGDGTFKSAFTFRRIKGTNEVEKPSEK